jgi:FAD dependent oxidoreductase
MPPVQHPGTRLAVVLGAALALLPSARAGAQPERYDIVVYGGTSAGVIAAVQAARMGRRVAVVGPDVHLGGLSSAGLGFTDTGNKAVIGGLAREFYHRVWQHYQRPQAWRWQPREAYGNRGQGTPAMDGANRTMWIFEPHVAEGVFEALVAESRIPVFRDEWLDRAGGVAKSGSRIASIRMLSGRTFVASMFIDATYEGDLMAAAGVDYHVGREAQRTYGESWNGVQTGVLHHRHHFGVLPRPISPYVVPGDPSSGVLPRISTAPPGERGEGDRRVQAYCYRYAVTDHPDNRLPFPKPPGYDPSQYALLLRVFDAGWRETFQKFDAIPNRKTDSNNHGPFSSDNIGFNYDYPEASYARRREILREHETYQKGWLYFIANDPRVPKDAQDEMRRYGLPGDEFTDNGGWPHQIYVREARRMIGRFVMTQHQLQGTRPTPEPVGMGSYTIDSHNVQRYITPDGHVQNEGDIGVPLDGPYAIAYGALVPKAGQADNLLVPVAVSASHIAFGSIRMEPVFMVLGQSAATAAAIALDRGVPVQDVPYAALRARLVADGQVLEYKPGGSPPQ